VNWPEVVEYAKTLPCVEWARVTSTPVLRIGLSSIRNRIKELHLNRVVVASCTPRTHEPLFRKNCERAGLNKYLFEFVNLREHCSWVHMEKPAEPTSRPRICCAMGVAKVSLLQPGRTWPQTCWHPQWFWAESHRLVCRSELGQSGLPVDIVEKEEELEDCFVS